MKVQIGPKPTPPTNAKNNLTVAIIIGVLIVIIGALFFSDFFKTQKNGESQKHRSALADHTEELPLPEEGEQKLPTDLESPETSQQNSTESYGQFVALKENLVRIQKALQEAVQAVSSIEKNTTVQMENLQAQLAQNQEEIKNLQQEIQQLKIAAENNQQSQETDSQTSPPLPEEHSSPTQTNDTMQEAAPPTTSDEQPSIQNEESLPSPGATEEPTEKTPSEEPSEGTENNNTPPPRPRLRPRNL